MEGKYIPLFEYGKSMGIKKGDKIFISSDTETMLMDAWENGEALDLNLFIDGLIDSIGEEGTVVIPTYNWDFCKSTPFHYKKTHCQTGSLGTVALKREDFCRTRHPIYSFAVYGKYQDEFIGMNNKSAFGLGSPFHFMYEKKFVNYIIDVPLRHSFTFAHYVEEISGAVSYRYLKEFTADYTYADVATETRTYSMFVRKLELDVDADYDFLENEFLRRGIEKQKQINNSTISNIDLTQAYTVVMDDILYNNSKLLCKYKGQK